MFAFVDYQVHQQLLRCTQDYIAELVELRLTFDTERQSRMLWIRAPELFDYYKNDFGKENQDRALWIVNHTPYNYPNRMRLLQFAQTRRTKLMVIPFDWSPIYRIQSKAPGIS